MNWLKELFGIVPEIVKSRNNLKVARIEAETTAIQSRAQQEGAWEAMAAENARNSWLDEYWTAVLTVPLILAFVGAGDTVDAGFKALENVPEWYVWGVISSLGFAFCRKTLPGVASWLRKP